MIPKFLAEVQQVLLGEAAFDEGARIHAGRSVSLVIDKTAWLPVDGAAEEVVLSNLDESRE